MNHGKIAYEAYCKATGGKSLISGDELPAWEALKPEIQNAWTQAGLAVEYETTKPRLRPRAVTVQEAARRGFEGIQHKGQ